MINSVTSRKAISNEIIKNKNQWRNGGDSVFDAIRGSKKYLETEPEGKFLIVVKGGSNRNKHLETVFSYLERLITTPFFQYLPKICK